MATSGDGDDVEEVEAEEEKGKERAEEEVVVEVPASPVTLSPNHALTNSTQSP